jgi:hypothetical protein
VEREDGGTSNSETAPSRHNKNEGEKGRRRGQSSLMKKMEDLIIKFGRTAGLTRLNQANRKSSTLTYSKEDILERFLELFNDLEQETKYRIAQDVRETERLRNNMSMRRQ